MKYLGLEIYILRIQILAAKNDVILLKNSAFCKVLILRFIFQFSTFILRESSKWCLIFSYFTLVFEKSAIAFIRQLFEISVIDLFLDSDSFYNCIPHFSSERSNLNCCNDNLLILDVKQNKIMKLILEVKLIHEIILLLYFKSVVGWPG